MHTLLAFCVCQFTLNSESGTNSELQTKHVGYLLTMQVGVGDHVDADQLRAIVSANQSYTTLIESNFTLLPTSLTDKLTDILCNSQFHTMLITILRSG